MYISLFVPSDRRRARLFFAALAGFLLLITALGQGARAQLLPAAKSAEPENMDIYGRESPRGLSNGLIGALSRQDYDQAGEYFDLSGIAAARRTATGAAIARRLQQVLDAGGDLIQPLQLSNDAGGRINDQLAPNEERIGTLPASDGGEPVPLIATSSSQEGKVIWRISRGSLTAIMTRSASADSMSLRDRMPSILRETSVLGAAVADWLLLLGGAALCCAVVRFLCLVMILAIGRYSSVGNEKWWCRAIRGAPTALSLWVGLLIFMAATRSLEASIVAKQVVNRFAGAVALLAFSWFVWRMVDLAADLIAARMEHGKRLRARSILIFMRRALKLLILLFAAVQALKILGIDVTTGIAALGLGGLAIALGAQKTVENLVGSVSVVADEPIRVGDFCKVGNVSGTVEEIGIRSTRIRTNERTVVTIPNGNFSSLQIENFSARDRILLSQTLRLSIDLDAEGIARVLHELRDALAGASDLADGARVHLKGFGDSWIEIELFAWINERDANAARDRREELLLEVVRRIENAGGRFFGSTRPVPVPAEEPKTVRKVPARLSSAK